MKKTLLSALLGLAIVISCEKKQETTENQDHPFRDACGADSAFWFRSEY
jgi:murein endopeptidase